MTAEFGNKFLRSLPIPMTSLWRHNPRNNPHNFRNDENIMALKRSYQTPSKYTPNKRARTLDSQIQSLKKQVSSNKKELKYYDGTFGSDIQDLSNQSIFKDVLDDAGLADNPVFIGRKAHIKKIEFRFELQTTQQSNDNILAPSNILIWRTKRLGKVIPLSDSVVPLAIDPEYHSLLRYWERGMDDGLIYVKHMAINFGGPGRLVEFDDQSTATATGDIVAGDILVNFKTFISPAQPTSIPPVSFRVWYTDN